MTPARKSAGSERRAAESARLARKLIRPVKDDIINLLRRLVRIDSVAVPPDGNEAPAQKELLKTLKTSGLDARLYDTGFLNRSRHPLVRRERNYAGRPNLIAKIPGDGDGRSLLFSGHIDTVTAPGKWRESPLSGSIRGGRLYGRGAWDMKGGLAAHFGALMALAKARMRLKGDLLAESVVDEEWAGGGGTLAARLSGITADACVITECTNLAVLRASRGGFFLDIIARAGDPSAYFTKEEVVSPALPMGRVLEWIDTWRKKRKNVNRRKTYADFEDPAPVQVLALEANRFDPETPWSTPLEAKVRVYFQFLPHENVPAVIRRIRKSFDSFCRRDPFFKRFPPQWKPVVDPPLLGHELPERHPFTRTMSAAADASLAREAPVSASEWPCDAFVNQREFGIPTLVFGPEGAGAHNVNEYVKVRSVIQTAETLLTTALLWCGY
jgi:acetylornithine deacetylase